MLQLDLYIFFMGFLLNIYKIYLPYSLAKPKSAIFTIPSLVNNKFDNLISLCKIKLELIYAKPFNNYKTMHFISFSRKV